MKNIENQIPDITNLATNVSLNTKIKWIKDEILSVINLATTAVLTSFEYKKPSISNLVKRTDCNTKVNKIEKKIIDHDHDKYVTAPEFTKLASSTFAARLTQASLASS